MSISIFSRNRREREFIIVTSMFRIYCRSEHGGDSLCSDCRHVLGYAEKRLSHCKFGDAKPVCKECPVHCYSPEMREKVKQVMRKAGPKMIWRHPLYALIHIFDSRKHQILKEITS